MNVRSFFAFCLLPLLVLSSHAQTLQPVFSTVPSFTPPGPVVTSASGDFDGDGAPDFIYTDATSHVVVLLNRGANNPPIVVTSPSLTCTAHSLVIADMNKDGKLDAVVSCSEGYVIVLLGHGDGTFQAPVSYAVNQILQVQPPVDLNGDGFPDIVGTTGVTQGTAVAVLLNKGSSSPGVLSNPQTYSYPANGMGPIAGIGDFDGDGKQDVAVFTATLMTSPSIFFGNGDGTLQAAQAQPQTCGTGSTLGPAVAGDFNNDGISDLAVQCGSQASGGPQSMQMWFGSTSGQLTAGPVTTLPPVLSGNLTYSSPIVIGTNGDKNLDLALPGNSLQILLGDGKGGFSLGQNYAVSGALTPEPPDANGIVNLTLYAGETLFFLNSNGDGTFQAPLLFSPASVTADFNGDGIADVLGLSQSNLVVALGRGNGEFTITNQQPSVNGTPIAADFDGDGKLDAVAIRQGAGIGHGETTSIDAQVNFYKGNGDGTFQAAGTPIDVPIYGAMSVVAADFNGDGKTDLLVGYNNLFSSPAPTGYGLILLTGNGDGTFTVPSAPFFQNSSGLVTIPPILVGDLNGDHKPDLIWENTVFLNNGDGTFQQSPLAISGKPHALADLNGDGKLDLIAGMSVQDPITQSYSYPESVFGGNGDGTFQSTPFYSANPPQSAQGTAAVVGDVNNDGHPDLIVQYATPDGLGPIAVYFGDGTGNFIQDSNTYYGGLSSYYLTSSPPALSLVRLNNNAPAVDSDKTLDLLAFVNSGVTPLLNENNPAPGTAVPLPSHISISVSPSSAGTNQPFTFTVSVAGVTGANPTGTVTLTSGSTTLATQTLTGGSATLSTSFATAGTYSVTASYSGDANNQPSTSSAQSVTVITPDYSLTANPGTATIKAGQTATFSIAMATVGGYSGTVKLSCGNLPAEATCAFSPATLTGSGTAASSTLTITTTAAHAMLERPGSSSGPIALWAVILGLCLSPRRALRSRKQLARVIPALLLAAGSLIWLAGCSSSSSTPKDTGTPTGSQTITVSAADSGSGPSHGVNIQLTVQ